jgi:hypothetical protein
MLFKGNIFHYEGHMKYKFILRGECRGFSVLKQVALVEQMGFKVIDNNSNQFQYIYIVLHSNKYFRI